MFNTYSFPTLFECGTAIGSDLFIGPNIDIAVGLGSLADL